MTLKEDMGCSSGRFVQSGLCIVNIQKKNVQGVYYEWTKLPNIYGKNQAERHDSHF